MLRSKLLAACTAVVLALGFSLGGASAAMAATPDEIIGGPSQTCNDLIDVKPYESVPTSGTYTATDPAWGTFSWNDNVVEWDIEDGYSVTFCVKGGNTGAHMFYDQTGSDSWSHPYGLSHFGFTVTGEPPVATASITVIPADCEESTSLDFDTDTISNATWGSPVIDGDEISITATRTGQALFDAGAGVSGDRTTKTFTFTFEQAPVGDCGPGEATAAVTIDDPDCFDNASTLIAPDDANSSNVASWSEVTTEVDGDDTYLVITATATEGYVFPPGDGVSGDGTQKTFRVLQETVTDDDCVLPAIGVVAASEPITCEEPDGWFSFGPGAGVSDADAALIVWTVGPAAYADDDEPGVQHSVSETVTITVTASLVESAKGDYALSDESGGGVVDPETGDITWTFQFTEATDCDEVVIVPDVDYVDECENASYTIYAVDGVSYTRTVNGFEFPVVFPDGEDSVTFPAALLDSVKVEATALDGYRLADDYEPWEYEFTEGFCPPTGPATTAAVEFTIGECEGDSFVELTDEGGVIWRINGTIVDGNATHSLPAGADVEVTASLEGPSDEQPLGWTWSDPEQQTSWTESIPAADPECSPELASTGLGSLAEQVGVLAVLLTLAGMGLVIRRRANPIG